jgi:hypothetical protein
VQLNPESDRLREEILRLLRTQMEVLATPAGLSDVQLMECYDRQTRVQELREKLCRMEQVAAAIPRTA